MASKVQAKKRHAGSHALKCLRQCLTRVWRARLYQLWQTHLTFIRFKALQKERREVCHPFQAGINRNLPFGTAPFSLDRWTLLMPQGVCRMDVHWSQCAPSVGNTVQGLCVCVYMCVFSFMVCYQAILWQSWCTWLYFCIKCNRSAIAQQQKEQSWAVSPWPLDQIHCCITGAKKQKNFGWRAKTPQTNKWSSFFCPLYLPLFLSLLQR